MVMISILSTRDTFIQFWADMSMASFLRKRLYKVLYPRIKQNKNKFN